MVDVRDDIERLAQDARIHDDGLQPQRLEPIPQIRDLGSLGIQGADDDDGFSHESWVTGH